MSGRPSESVSVSKFALKSGKGSSASAIPSPSSSLSAFMPNETQAEEQLLGRPSPSRSSRPARVTSWYASLLSFTPSPSSSGSALFPIPSPSVSKFSVTVVGNESKRSVTPSPSVSVSTSGSASIPAMSNQAALARLSGYRPKLHPVAQSTSPKLRPPGYALFVIVIVGSLSAPSTE